MKSGFARAKVPCVYYLEVLSVRIDAKKKQMNDNFKDIEKNV